MQARSAHLLARIAAFRLLETVGVAGVVGLALLVVSCAWTLWGWHWHEARMPGPPVASGPAAAVAAASAPSAIASAPVPRLHGSAELDQVLLQIEHVAVSSGLAWPSADNQWVKASEALPSSLVVRASLRGPYPKWREALTRWSRQVPGLGIRSVHLQRTSSELADVDGEVVLVVFLRDEPASAQKGSGQP